MAKLSFGKAINRAIDEEMTRDKNVVCIGEDIGPFGFGFGVMGGLWDKFGGSRIIDTPIAEATIIGVSVGMALAGMKVIPELMFADFVDDAMDEINDKMGKWRYMHGGYMDMPITLRLPVGIGGGGGPEHSRSVQAQFMNSQGLIIAVPSTPYDAYGLMKTSIRGKDPVLWIEHRMLGGIMGEVPDEEYFIPFGKADIKKEGKDVTIIATTLQVHTSLAAAAKLEAEGISVEVLDPRTIIPLDKACILNSVKKTGRLVIVHEEAKTGGTGAELAAIIAEEAFSDLKAPIRRVAAPDMPIAQSMLLEQLYVPNEAQIIAAVKDVMKF